MKIAAVLILVIMSSVVRAESTVEPMYHKEKIRIKSKTITVEIADDDEKRQHGLMFRKSLADNTGMLFVFDYQRSLAFWMKNTLIPLSIGYFDSEKKLIDAQEMAPLSVVEKEPKTYRSAGLAKYALEMPKGWFAKNKIEVGTTFSYVDPELNKSHAH